MSLLKQTFADGEVLSASHLNAMIAAIDNNTLGVQDINSRITNIPDLLDLKELVFYRGEVSVEDLINLSSESTHSIYKLVDTQENILKLQNDFGVSFSNNSYVVCIKPFTSKLTSENFSIHWKTRTGFYEKASSTYSGIVSTEYQEYAGLKTFLNGIEVKGTLDLKEGNLRVTDDQGLLQVVNIPPNLNGKLKSFEDEIDRLWEELSKTYPDEELPEHLQAIKRDIISLREDFSSKDSYLEGLITGISDAMVTTNIAVNTFGQKVNDLEETVYKNFNADLTERLEEFKGLVNTNIQGLSTRITSVDTTINNSLNSLSQDFTLFKENISSTVTQNYQDLSEKVSSLENQQSTLNSIVTSNKEDLDQKLESLAQTTQSTFTEIANNNSIIKGSLESISANVNVVNNKIEDYKKTNNTSLNKIRNDITTYGIKVNNIESNYPVRVLTQGEYNNLPLKKASTLYFIVEYGDAKRLYIGKHLIARKLEGNNYFDYSFPIIF